MHSYIICQKLLKKCINSGKHLSQEFTILPIFWHRFTLHWSLSLSTMGFLGLSQVTLICIYWVSCLFILNMLRTIGQPSHHTWWHFQIRPNLNDLSFFDNNVSFIHFILVNHRTTLNTNVFSWLFCYFYKAIYFERYALRLPWIQMGPDSWVKNGMAFWSWTFIWTQGSSSTSVFSSGEGGDHMISLIWELSEAVAVLF